MSEFFPYALGLSGPGGSAQWIGPTPTGPTGWVTLSVLVDESNWNVTSGTWAGLLSDVTSFSVRIELVGTSVLPPDQDGVDNVRISGIPEPSSFVLLGAAGTVFAFALAKRRTKC